LDRGLDKQEHHQAETLLDTERKRHGLSRNE